VKYRPVRQHRQLPRWDHACSSASPPRAPSRVVPLALQRPLAGHLPIFFHCRGFVSSPRILRSFPRFFFHSCRLAPSSRTWISVELSRSDDFNLSTGRKKSGTHSNRGEPPLVPASFILRPYIRPLFISFSLSPVPLVGRPVPQTCSYLLFSLYLFLFLIFAPCVSLSLSLCSFYFRRRAIKNRLLRGCYGIDVAIRHEWIKEVTGISSGCFDIVEIVGRW